MATFGKESCGIGIPKRPVFRYGKGTLRGKFPHPVPLPEGEGENGVSRVFRFESGGALRGRFPHPDPLPGGEGEKGRWWRRALLLWLAVSFLTCFAGTAALAAVGCDLNDPIRDVPRLFKESTSFKTRYLTIKNVGGDPLLRRIESRLGQKYVPLYAPIDVPYTLYEIYNGAKKVGYIHGVNQKGQFGGLQVFVAQDLNGRIKTFYLQKITGPSAGKFRDARFSKHFLGLSLQDFDSYDPASGKGSGKFAELRNPAPDMETDFYGILRGLKKNLILMDEFVFSGNGSNR